MSKKYKLTGCARFFIFLLIVAPIVYFGVSYFQGEDPFALIKDTVENVKEKVDSNTSNSDTSTSSDDKKTKTSSGDLDETSILNGTIDAQKKRIKDQNDYIETLENQIEQLKKQIERQKSRDIPVKENIEN